MTKKQIEKEWDKIRHEVIYNKPQIDSPYPPNVVRKRELLLFAQAFLSNVMKAKLKRDRKKEYFHTELYNTAITHYFDWKDN